MTKTLQQAIERLQQVPEDRQDALAALLLYELDEDERWSRSTSTNVEKLRGLVQDVTDSSLVVTIHPDVISPEARETAARLGVLQHLPRVIDLTREVFGSFSRVTVSEDPDFGDTHILFHVPARRTIEEGLDKDEEWGKRMLEIIPRSPQVYLTVTESAPPG